MVRRSLRSKVEYGEKVGENDLPGLVLAIKLRMHGLLIPEIWMVPAGRLPRTEMKATLSNLSQVESAL